MQSILRGLAKHLEISDGERSRQQAGTADVRDGFPVRDLLWKRGSRRPGLQLESGNRDHGSELGRRKRPEAIGLLTRRRADGEAAFQTSGYIVGVALDLCRQGEQLGLRQRPSKKVIGRDEAGDDRRCAASEPPCHGDFVVHLHVESGQRPARFRSGGGCGPVKEVRLISRQHARPLARYGNVGSGV